MDIHYHGRIKRVVEQICADLGIEEQRIIDALAAVPRHLFVDEAMRPRVCSDDALPIGHGQTISKISTVAMMTAALGPRPGERVLEVGTGSGYQAAVLAGLCERVYSVERIAQLAIKAKGVFNRLGLFNIEVRTGDGALGWPEHAPFDKIIVTAAAGSMPQTLLEQLAVGGKLVTPVEEGEEQTLTLVIKKDAGTYEQWDLDACRFVPLISKGGGR